MTFNFPILLASNIKSMLCLFIEKTNNPLHCLVYLELSQYDIFTYDADIPALGGFCPLQWISRLPWMWRIWWCLVALFVLLPYCNSLDMNTVHQSRTAFFRNFGSLSWLPLLLFLCYAGCSSPLYRHQWPLYRRTGRRARKRCKMAFMASENVFL